MVNKYIPTLCWAHRKQYEHKNEKKNISLCLKLHSLLGRKIFKQRDKCVFCSNILGAHMVELGSTYVFRKIREGLSKVYEPRFEGVRIELAEKNGSTHSKCRRTPPPVCSRNCK